MAQSTSKITDAVHVELNGPDMSQYSLEELNEMLEGDDENLAEQAEDELARRFDAQQKRTPDRPTDKASRAAWVDYAVSLGADRDFLENETEHYDGAKSTYVKAPAFSKADVVELVGRLGG